MKPYIAQFLVMFLAAALVLPSVGPILDHHFAERHPQHHHLGPSIAHTHIYGADHFHHHTPVRNAGEGNQPSALYNYDSGLATGIVIVGDNTAMQSFLRFEPTSLFTVPSPPQARLHSAYTSPPEKPPQHPL